ncbi:transposase family protein [Streptomyces sp. NPDC088246]|uniref:transposase family protein n=1 Tax=Streptomyces sp. NPDC088246 TaxID=3365842 RepID=UPI00382D7CB1
MAQMPDRRARRGLRHPLVVVLVLTACATLVVGGDCVAAIWQWAARSPQDKLARIGARRDPLTGRYLVPSERTFRRVLTDLDADALDAATCGYTADVVRGAARSPRLRAPPAHWSARSAAPCNGRPSTRPRPGCCPPRPWTAKPCAAPTPRPGRSSWSARSPTPAAR